MLALICIRTILQSDGIPERPFLGEKIIKKNLDCMQHANLK